MFCLLVIAQLFPANVFGQEESVTGKDSIEVFIIDSYIPQENPNKFILSFYTSEPCKTKLLIGELFFFISEELNDNHRIEIDLDKINLKNKSIFYVIQMENETGEKTNTEVYELEVYKNDEELKPAPNNYFTCLAGGIVFLTPSFSLVQMNGKTYYELNKELPVISLFSSGFNYPTGYFALEYAHIINAEKGNYLRVGYKHIYEIPKLEFISIGLSGFSNFNKSNGFSPELSLGLFKLYNVFTLYSRYRYNVALGSAPFSFSEYSVGLYSSFFTLHW